MNFYTLSLFPDMIANCFNTSITGRALAGGKLTLENINIRDFANNKHMKVDDYPYGGGAGLVMQAEPVYGAYEHARNLITKRRKETGRKTTTPVRVVYMTPRGETFTQRKAEELVRHRELIFLCGHYEGIDERVLEEIVTDNISIGDYILTGGELASLVVMDAVARLVPGVLHNDESAVTDSFSDGLLEYPHYTRPEVFHGKRVPDVLLSGHHANVDAWRLEKSLEITKRIRPDLYEEYIREGSK